MPCGVYKRSPEELKRLSERMKEIRQSGQPKGRKLKESTKKKISLAKRGVKRTTPVWNAGKTYSRLKHKYKPYQEIFWRDRYYVVDYERKGWVHRSVFIMEKYLGRKLNKGEIVHHINKIKTDDRIENLKLFNSVNEHIKEHHNILGHKTPPEFIYKPRVIKVPKKFLGV